MKSLLCLMGMSFLFAACDAADATSLESDESFSLINREGILWCGTYFAADGLFGGGSGKGLKRNKRRVFDKATCSLTEYMNVGKKCADILLKYGFDNSARLYNEIPAYVNAMSGGKWVLRLGPAPSPVVGLDHGEGSFFPFGHAVAPLDIELPPGVQLRSSAADVTTSFDVSDRAPNWAFKLVTQNAKLKGSNDCSQDQLQAIMDVEINNYIVDYWSMIKEDICP